MKNIKRNFFWNSLGSTFASFNSLFFFIIVTRFNGVNLAGLFSFSFSLATVFWVIGNYSGRVFQITEHREDILDVDYLYNRYVTIFFMIIALIIYCLLKGYSLYKVFLILILASWKITEIIGEVFYAVIQKNHELHIVGKSLFYKAIISLLLFFAIDYLTHNILISSVVLIFVNIFVLLVYDFRNAKLSLKRQFDFSKMIFLLKSGFSVFGFTFLTLYLINVSKFAIDLYYTDNYQTIFTILLMPATIVVLFGQYLVQPFLYKLKSEYRDSLQNFTRLIVYLTLGVLFLGGLSFLVAYFLGIYFLELVYGLPLIKYKNCLLIIMTGGGLYGGAVVFSTALTTMRKTFPQLLVFLLVCMIAYGISKFFVRQNPIWGASFTYFVSMTLLFIILAILFFCLIFYQIKHEKQTSAATV